MKLILLQQIRWMTNQVFRSNLTKYCRDTFFLMLIYKFNSFRAYKQDTHFPLTYNINNSLYKTPFN